MPLDKLVQEDMDTVKILNDDDALELFKKTLPGSASLLQVKVTAKEMKQMALDTIKGVKGQGRH